MGRPRKLPTISRSSEVPPLMPREEWRDLSCRLSLPPRQAEIIGLILQGKRDKQIASCLELSHSTVRTHLRQVFSRFNVTDRVELVLRIAAIRQTKTSSKLMTSNLPNCSHAAAS